MRKILILLILLNTINFVSACEDGCKRPELTTLIGIFISITKILIILFVVIVIYGLIKNKRLKGGKR